MLRVAPLALVPSILTFCPNCFAQSTIVPRVGWEVFVAYADALPVITAGVDDGSGFQFETLADNDGDGIIRLPRVPVGSQLALSVHHNDRGEDFHIWDISSGGIIGGASIEHPLFITADISQSSPGVHYKPLFAFLVDDLDGRINVIDGRADELPNVLFVDASNAPDLATFAQLVDTLPAFNGNVAASDARVRFTFVPEPSAAMLLLTGGIGLTSLRPHKGCNP